MAAVNVDFVYNASIVSTVAVFSTGIPQCLQMAKQKSTKNVPFLPYITTFANNMAWILYSTVTGDDAMFILNLIGAVLQIVYIVTYFIYGTSKVREAQHIGIAGLVTCLCWIFVVVREKDEVAFNAMAVICAIFTALMFSSPLVELKTVLETRSTESMSFPLTVATCCCTVLWVTYGYVMPDIHIIIPNVLGFLTSIPRFYFFAKFGRHGSNRSEIY